MEKRIKGYLFLLLIGLAAMPSIWADPDPDDSDCPGDPAQAMQLTRMSSTDEGTGPKYRKLGLNGFPLPDEKPQQKEESDQEPEETFIDAFNLSLTHQVTDIYVPMEGTDLTLSVRRNWNPEIWSYFTGLRPAFPWPDRPFGAGWHASLTPNIHFAIPFDHHNLVTEPGSITVTDENGTSYNFMPVTAVPGGDLKYMAMPSNRNQQEVLANTLEQTGSTQYVFTRKYGTKLTFTITGSAIVDYRPVPLTEDPVGAGTIHYWARVDKAEDRYGTEMDYTYSGTNQASPLTPTSIGCRGKTILISGSNGLVNSVTDPAGNVTNYNYADFTITPDGLLPQTVKTLSAVVRADSSTTTYTYDGTSQIDHFPRERTDPMAGDRFFFVDIGTITDPNGHAYTFHYNFDMTRSNYFYKSGWGQGWYRPSGNPRNVVQVDLPEGYTSNFENHSNVWLGVREEEGYQPMGYHTINVTDAAGGSWSYHYTGGQATRLNDFAEMIYGFPSGGVNFLSQSLPVIITYSTMTVATPESGTMIAKFNPSAGMAIASLQDVSSGTDAVTKFVYSDTFDFASRIPFFSGTTAAAFPIQYWGDPTAQINALSGTKTFHYASGTATGDWRIMDSVLDENGHLTTYTIDSLGRRTKELVYSGTQAYGPDLIQETDFVYSSSTFKGIATSKTVKVLSSEPSANSWATDLVTTFTLNGTNGNVMSETVGTGTGASVTQHTYDNNNRKLSTTDPNGSTTSFVYDSVGHLTKTIFPSTTVFSGTTTVTVSGSKQLFYDARGNKTQEIDENGNSSFWQYDNLNRVVKEVRDLNGNGSVDANTTDIITQTTYTPLNAKATVISPTSGTSTMSYDGLNRLVSTTDPLGNTTTLSYGANSGGLQFGKDFQPTRTVDARGFNVFTTYDKNYRPIQKDVQYSGSGTSGNYSTTKTEYDGVGNVVKAYDPLSTSGTLIYTQTTYDALNRPTLVVFTDSTTNHTYYTTTGLKYEVDDELGNDTLTEYDDHGRPVKVSSPVVDNGSGTNARAVTQTTYDKAGNTIAIKNPLNYSTTFTFDARNRKASETRPGTGSPTFYTKYDKVGNVTKTTDALGNNTLTEYDRANRPTKVTLPAVAVYGSGTSNPITTKEYDKSGNVTKVTDPNSHDTLNVYDKKNQLLTTSQVVSSGTIKVTNEYDEVGNRTKVKDGLNQATTFTYDGLKRNLTIKDAQTWVKTFVYNAADKTFRINEDGGYTAYEYDKRHRVTKVSYKWSATGASINDGLNPDRTYTYDATGNLLAVSEPAKAYSLGEVAYTYDALKRVLTETSNSLTHTYKYDLAGNRIDCAYGGISSGATGWHLASAYDEQNRLTTLSQVSTGTYATLATTYAYDLNGNILTKTLPNGDAETSTFDALNRTASLTSTSGTNALCGYAYEYDAASNVAKVTESYGNTALNRTVTNTYDQANRLTQEVTTGSAALTTSFTYDDANNRTSMAKGGVTWSYTYNNLNQLTQASDGVTADQHTYYYNGNGGRYWEYIGSGTLPIDYFYNFEMQLIGCKKEADGYLYNLTYDYRSRRVNRQVYTYTVPDPSSGLTNLFQNATFSGGQEVRVLEGDVPHHRYPSVDYVRGSDWGGGVGGILYSIRSTGPSFTHYNRRGDVTTKTDLSGAVTYQATYEAYGKRVTETGSTLDPQKSNTKDEDIPGYANEGFRFRDLETGVFISRDPAGFVDGPNLYTYVVDNPWTHFDPEGLANEDHAKEHPVLTQILGIIHGITGGFIGASSLPQGGGNPGEGLAQLKHDIEQRSYDPLGSGESFGSTITAAGLTEFGGRGLKETFIEGKGTVVESAKGMSDKAQFAQKTYSTSFSKEGQAIYSKLAGTDIKTISDLVKAIKDGKVNISDIAVEYVRKGNNQLIVNTRSAKALEQAGVPRSEWNAVDKTDDQATRERVNDQLRKNGLDEQGHPDPKPKEKKKTTNNSPS